MDGRAITLGVVAGLAVAGLARRSAGSGNTRPGRFRKISPPPTGFTLSPLSFVRGTVLELAVDPEETGRPQPGTGLYHVTTNLPAVLAEGRLRSRSELRAAGRQGAGLGGGDRDEAPDRVSVGLTLDGALRVLRGTQMMAQAVHGQIDARAALATMRAISGNALDRLDAAGEWHADDLEQLEERVLRATPGPDLYDALQSYEAYIADTLGEWVTEGWVGMRVCEDTVGFTEPASKFLRVQPTNVGLLQLAGRQGVRPDLVPSECELRFRPEDLALVGVWEGR